jgi:predicted metal-binding membrane protein
MASPRNAVTAAALAATLGLAGASWVMALERMREMNLGVKTPLGSFGFFVVLWVLMMAAMMLPGAVPAVMRRGRANAQVRAVPLFVGSYLAVWTVVGLVTYELYRPHGSVAAGVGVIAAGLYELTPLKQRCRRQCHDCVGSGFQFGLYCVGSSIGLMLILFALGVMDIAWMCIIAAVVVGQKLLPRSVLFDVPLALSIIGLGVLILIAPSTLPGLMPAM